MPDRAAASCDILQARPDRRGHFRRLRGPGSHQMKKAILAGAIAALALAAASENLACTRTLYVGADNTVITGRNMDWKEDMASNLWVFPAGMARDGAAGLHSIKWRSKYGSVIVSGY